MRRRLELRPNCGARTPVIERAGKLEYRCRRGMAWLRTTVPMEITDGSLRVRTRVKAGESLLFSLSYSENAPAVLPPLEQIPERIDSTLAWWRRRAAQARYDGEFKPEVIRSALALKLLIFAPSGAIVASPTTSLPERVGGGLNWDYRYCWLRDASLTIRALLELGFWDEVTSFLDWMLDATRLTRPELRTLYTVFGNPAPHERELAELQGYGTSRTRAFGSRAPAVAIIPVPACSCGPPWTGWSRSVVKASSSGSGSKTTSLTLEPSIARLRTAPGTRSSQATSANSMATSWTRASLALLVWF